MEAFHALQAAGVCAGPQFDDEMLFRDPNVAARGWIRPLTTSDVDGARLHLGHAFLGLPQVWRRGSPALGEDNEYVYKKLIGVTDEEYLRLVDVGIATTDYLDASGNPV
jgi:crotonobetainyl-CoA:carnitine CoA-transferase CaiB-like acyl-CoA transferase